jgi:hypothetical protein
VRQAVMRPCHEDKTVRIRLRLASWLKRELNYVTVTTRERVSRRESWSLAREDSATAAAALEGLDLPGGWRVEKRLIPRQRATGGTFSHSYLVSNSDGRAAFLKAFDYSAALMEENTAEALQALTRAFLFERNLLLECGQARMSRVILSLGHGEVDVPGFGVLSRVNYLILERADRDVRHQRDLLPELDIAWTLRALHHIATGLHQLHGRGISHQDLKPSNVLVFDAERTSKLGDLGRAVRQGQVAPHEDFLIAGDYTYAPPELLYGETQQDAVVRRRACDAYHLGSMMMFLFSGVGTTGALMARLHPAHAPGAWTEGFREVLPFLRDAFNAVVVWLQEQIPHEYASDLVILFRELCDPDPFVRGDPKEPPDTARRFGVRRFVSRLDLLAREAELRLRHALQG